jgi:endonuclease III
LTTQKAGVVSSLATKEAELAAAKVKLDNLTATATTAQNAVNAQMRAIETATAELAAVVAKGDAAQEVVDAAEKKVADARTELLRLEGVAKTADTNAAAATAAVVKAEENLRLASRA